MAKPVIPAFRSRLHHFHFARRKGTIMSNRKIFLSVICSLSICLAASVLTAASEKWDGPVLNAYNGTVQGPSGKETYYNLDMSGVIEIMRSMGNDDKYWIREDGCKMLGDYIMCAANLDVHPRGSLVESSLGTCIVCDTGGFASANPNQLDIAVTW